jgi:sugar phosphate isomerase/epimerase
MKTLPIALQVYSIRDEAQADFRATMEEVKKMGYDGVELAGLYGMRAEEVRDCLQEVGLTPISAHVSYEELMKDLEGTVQDYATIGCQYIAIPYLMEDCRYGTEKYKEFIGNIPVIAKECVKHNITLLYHNHDFEFEKTTEDNYVIDSLYEQFPKEILQTEFDTCWIAYAGENPVNYINKYSGRCPVIHLKDYTMPPFSYRPVGHGVQDIPEILKAAVNAGTKWVVVEQDDHSDNSPMEDCRISREYLRTIGW